MSATRTKNNSAGGPGDRADLGWRIAWVAFSLFIGLFGLAMTVGGVWLIAVGGSWYYGLAGLGLLVVMVLLLRRRQAGQVVMASIWLASLIWAFSEVGLNGWGLIPRVVGITVLFILALAVSPVLNAAQRTRI